MRKCLPILALLVFFPLCSQPLRGQAPTVRVQAGSEKKSQTELAAPNPQNDQRGTKNSPLVIELLGRPNSEAEAAEAKAEKDHKNFVDRWTLILAGLVAFFTGLLVFVGWRGVNAANRTLVAIEKQTELQSRAIDLQERAMEQSVYLTNWKVSKLKIDPRKLRMTVDLVNQSTFPLTLREGHLSITEIGGSRKYSIGEATFLPPNNPMQIEIIVTAVPEQLTAFEQGSLSFRVTGGFSHIDRISGKKIDQPVSGWLECGYWGTRFHWELHMNPVESEPLKGDTEDQNPN